MAQMALFYSLCWGTIEGRSSVWLLSRVVDALLTLLRKEDCFCGRFTPNLLVGSWGRIMALHWGIPGEFGFEWNGEGFC